MKWLKRIGVGLIVLLVVLILVANFFLGSIVKSTVNSVGPLALGVPVSLADANFRLLQGKLYLKGFVLGNPEGFKSDHAISVGEVAVDLDMKTILSDTIHVRRVYVDKPEISYELGLGTSNVGTILDKLGGDKKEPTPQSKKKVIIDDFLIENGGIVIAAKLTGGVGAPVPLPTIHMKDLGKDEGGTSVVDVFKKVFGAIISSATGLVSGTGKLIGEGAGAVGDAIGSVLGGGEEKAKE